MRQPPKNPRTEMVMFRRLLKRTRLKIQEHMDWTEEKVDMWFATPNPWCGNISPLKFAFLRPDKFEKTVDALIEDSARASLKRKRQGRSLEL